jgi:hypothetical protein
VFSYRSPKLSSGPTEILEISAEIPKNFAEILEFFERRKMITLLGDYGNFCGVSEPVLNLTANF